MEPLNRARYGHLEADEIYGGGLHGVTTYYITAGEVYRVLRNQQDNLVYLSSVVLQKYGEGFFDFG